MPDQRFVVGSKRLAQLMLQKTSLSATGPTFRELFTPKLVTVLREGYGVLQLRKDAVAGLTVAIVALPLSMAIAIASGASPERGLYTAIVAGFLISALGGSRFQIGGPAGAFIVLVASSIERHGFEGFLLATMISGVLMIALGLFRLGAYIKYIPHTVTVGFTAGIAVIIMASQLTDLFGLTLPGKEPGPLLPKLEALWSAAPTVNAAAAGLAIGTIALIFLLRKAKPTWPGFLIAVVVASGAAAIFGLPVETIGTRFGGVPSSIPAPHFPPVTLDLIGSVMPDALAFTLLGSIESLLSAVVADTMSGRRHRSNCELVAQGVANIASALFGGLCATGTIARTATNVRSGAVGPISGMLHSLFLLGFMVFAAPLASYIPLSALAAILAVVAWNMAERHEFASILRRSRSETAVLLATFLLTVFRDLTEGIAAGVILGSLLFMHRMAQMVAVETGAPLLADDEADEPGRRPAEGSADGIVTVYRFMGPFFFGASATVAAALERTGGFPPFIILDFSAVPLTDLSGIAALKTFTSTARREGATILVAGATPSVRNMLLAGGLGLDESQFAPDVATARATAEAKHRAAGSA